MASFETFIEVESGESHDVTFVHSMMYLFEDGSEVHVVPTSAWCFDCGSVVVAEHLDSPEEIELTRKKMAAVIEGATDIEMVFLLDRPYPESAKKSLAESEKYWALFQNRQSPERCLYCEGTNIEKIQPDDDDIFTVTGGPTLKSTGFGMCDIGLEPRVVLSSEGEKLN